MADIKDLEAAFIKADEAGNTEDAQAFATEIKRMRGAPQGRPLPANAGLANFGASVAGLPVDTIENAINLTRAAQGGVAGLVGRTDFMPPLLQGSAGGSDWIRAKLRGTGMPGLSPDNPSPESKMGTLQYDLTSRGGMVPGAALPAVGSVIAEKIAGPEYAGVGALAARPVAQAIKPAMEGTSKWLMQKALKPSLDDLRSGDGAKAIDTMLREGFNPTKGGVEKMRAEISRLNDEVKVAISNSDATVNKNAVANRLQTALDKFTSQVNPRSDTASITKAWDEFLSHPLLSGKSSMPVQTAQDLKTGTYSALGNKAYGELKGADIEAQKALARGLREEISSAVPKVSPLNARQSELLNAVDISERRALMEGNKNPAGLALLAKDPMAGIGFLADRSSLAKSLAARGIYGTGNLLPASQGTLEALVQEAIANQQANRR